MIIFLCSEMSKSKQCRGLFPVYLSWAADAKKKTYEKKKVIQNTKTIFSKTFLTYLTLTYIVLATHRLGTLVHTVH